MKIIKNKFVSFTNMRSVLILLLCVLLFITSIVLLFSRERAKLNAEYEGMISTALNIHTESDAEAIKNSIDGAKRSIQTTETMLKHAENESVESFIKRRNETNPTYKIDYTTMEDIRTGELSSFIRSREQEELQQLFRGETVISKICYSEEEQEYFLYVIVPLIENGVTTGVLYTVIYVDDILPDQHDSAVYQDVKSSIVESNGTLIFNSVVPEEKGNLFNALSDFNLEKEDIRKIAGIIRSNEINSTTFERANQTYYVSAVPVGYNQWFLLSFVRGPDVLFRSTNIFRDVVRVSIITIFLTSLLAFVLFYQFLFNKKELRAEKSRNQNLTDRLQAMFDQHSALKVLIDMKTNTIVDVNNAACSYYGGTKEDLVGKSIHEFNQLPEKYLKKGFNETDKSKISFLAAPHKMKNGEIKILDVYASVIDDGEEKLIYSILFDTTDRERFRNELLREKELLRTTLRSIGDGVVTTDNQGMITSLNNVAEKLTGWTSKEAIGQPFTKIFVLENEETGLPARNPIQQVLETETVVGLDAHTQLINKKGETVSIADSAAPIQSNLSEIFGVVMVFRDVSEEKARNQKIEFLSYHDALTGVFNRRYLDEKIPKLERSGLEAVSVIMIDVNGLKITNDVFGHKAGDDLLKNAAQLMQLYCSEKDIIVRMGGDEFVILMPNKNLEEAEQIIQEIKDAQVTIEGSNLPRSLSLGCAYAHGEKGSISAAIQQAEKYMYQQKLLNGKSFRNSIISTLLATLYEKSNETEEHSKRLEHFCHLIGKKLRLSSKEMDELALLALLHDIGKVGIDPNILKKPGALTAEEWDEMRRHPEIGYRIARETPELAGIADLILLHHERWDGKGYPHGLSGENIPLACRILAVVDSFDAMTNDRVYRKAMTVEEAIEEIERNIGKQFDPQIARLMIDIITLSDE